MEACGGVDNTNKMAIARLGVCCTKLLIPKHHHSVSKWCNINSSTTTVLISCITRHFYSALAPKAKRKKSPLVEVKGHSLPFLGNKGKEKHSQVTTANSLLSREFSERNLDFKKVIDHLT